MITNTIAQTSTQFACNLKPNQVLCLFSLAHRTDLSQPQCTEPLFPGIEAFRVVDRADFWIRGTSGETSSNPTNNGHRRRTMDDASMSRTWSNVVLQPATSKRCYSDMYL